MSKEHFRLDQTEIISIDKSKSNEYKKYDVVEDIKEKSWIVMRISIENNSISLFKYPIQKKTSKRKNQEITLNLNNEKTVELISIVYR